MGFWRMDGGRKMKEWVGRWASGLKRSKTWGMELRSGKDGGIFSRSSVAMLHKDRTSVTEHIFYFLNSCESHEINSDELVFVLFFIILEGRSNWWFHTLPPTSIHSLLTFLKELHQAFDECDHQVVYEIISCLRMKPRESIEDFATHFLHLCHEIHERFVDIDFMSQELKHLVHVSWNGEPPDFPSSSTLIDHETPHVLKRVPPRSNYKSTK